MDGWIGSGGVVILGTVAVGVLSDLSLSVCVCVCVCLNNYEFDW